MAPDELPPRGALDASAAGDAAPTRAAETADDATARREPAAPDHALGATQALDVAGLIELEKRAIRRAVSADELDPQPQPMPGGRRARRETAIVIEALGLENPAPKASGSPAPRPEPVAPTTAALAWVDPAAIAARPAPAALSTSPHVPATADLLPPVRDGRRASVAAPLLTAGALAIAYVAGCALWPLGAVEPTVAEATVQPAAGKPLGVTWPVDGSAALGAEGLGTVAASGEAAAPMASITKLVTAMMILEKAPLGVGEDGPSYSFTAEDSQLYWQYRYQNESALDVPIDGTLTERQLLEGILVGSANNYVDRLTTELWGSKDAFVLAVPEWLEAHGLSGITMVDPSGIDPENTATPAALIKLASAAMADPIIADIVAMPEIDLPGAGKVENTNPLLGEPGVAGIKTGTLLDGWQEQWNLLTAKDITLGQTTVRVYAAVLGQPDEEGREVVSRTLLDQAEQSLQTSPSVTAGTTIATVTTEWGESAEVVTTQDASVILWDGGLPAIESEYDIEVGLADGANVGEFTATGPFDSTSIPLALEGDIAGPDLIWRLTHPLDLFGLQ